LRLWLSPCSRSCARSLMASSSAPRVETEGDGAVATREEKSRPLPCLRAPTQGPPQLRCTERLVRRPLREGTQRPHESWRRGGGRNPLWCRQMTPEPVTRARRSRKGVVRTRPVGERGKVFGNAISGVRLATPFPARHVTCGRSDYVPTASRCDQRLWNSTIAAASAL
jgi:hypothetical protein